MSICVCGHARREHAKRRMSVPMVNPAPLYPIPSQMMSVARTYPTSRYTRRECLCCGCCEFQPAQPGDP
jgi:hypothetical protein